MKNLKMLILSIGPLFLLFSCGNNEKYAEILTSHISEPVNHSDWTLLLNKYVDEDGWVDYRGFIKDSVALNSYLSKLSKNFPSGQWQYEEQLAYWINVYNAFTVKVIIDNYPIKSITDIKKFHIPLINTVWQDKVIPIGDKMLSLDYVEHELLRKVFVEPRIHFAINCASISCPKLRREAYTAADIESQLTEQAAAFINDPEKNVITSDKMELSKIFSWFKGDFTEGITLRDFINDYSTQQVNPDAKISYKNYDWGLNEQGKGTSD